MRLSNYSHTIGSQKQQDRTLQSVTYRLILKHTEKANLRNISPTYFWDKAQDSFPRLWRTRFRNLGCKDGQLEEAVFRAQIYKEALSLRMSDKF